jgi:hypothetical protein
MTQEEFNRQIECAIRCDSKTAVIAAMRLAYHHPGLAMAWYENLQKEDKGVSPNEKIKETLIDRFKSFQDSASSFCEIKLKRSLPGLKSKVSRSMSGVKLMKHIAIIS